MCFYGDPVLRKRCQPVEKITKEIRDLVEEMIKTMDEYKGIGLAASQVGKLLQIFVCRKEEKKPDGTTFLSGPLVYINPKLSNPSEEMEAFQEGCLSLPALLVEVQRPISIDIEYMDLDGKLHEERVHDFHARVLMHENDHLHGRLHFDRASKEEKKRITSALKAIKKKYKHTYQTP